MPKTRRQGRAPARRKPAPGPTADIRGSTYPGNVRIIAGIWRRRRLDVPRAEGLRPTPDRVRETVFNWLRPWLPGARCIDLFAGTGALCLEALSRGAARAVMVEAVPGIAAVLRANVARLAAEHAEIIEGDALNYLTGPVETFDIVFIDPPFRSELIAKSARLLTTRGWLAPGALIYIEAPSALGALPVPESWEPLHSGIAGQVGYHLLQRRR
jgi:16S rRNA (guanine966-N2)-methyltransferase